MSRFRSRTKFRNDNENIKPQLDARDLKFIVHFETPILDHPNYEQLTQLNMVNHVWVIGDKYYKIAHKHYGDSRLWWVVAWINQRPTESHVSIGDTILIPHPIDKVLSYLKV